MSSGPSAFVEALGLFVLAAGLVVLTARWARLPSIVSYIVAGLLLGPVTGLATSSPDPHAPLHLIGEMGIVLLMFIVGLELSLDRIRQVGGVALAAGLGQVVFTAAGGFGLCMLLDFSWIEATFLSVALTFSSTVVVVKLLDQKDDLHSLYGRIAVGIFLVQDLVVIIVLTFVAGLGSPEQMKLSSVAAGLGVAFGGMAVLLVVCLAAARYVLPTLLGWVASAPRTLFVWSLGWCLAFVLAADALGLSAEIGAFVAGLSIAQLRYADDLRRRMHPLMSFFIAIFFVSLGVQMDPGQAGTYWLESLVLSLFVLVGNPLIFMWIIARYGYSERTCFMTSVTVAQISEFSFIFATMGVRMGLIGSPILAVVALVGFVTIAVSAYMILYNRELYNVVSKTGALRMFGASRAGDDEPPSQKLDGHVIIVGMNALGKRLARDLHERGETVVAIDTDPDKLAEISCRTLLGNVEHDTTLEEASLSRARLAVSALRIESTNKLFAFQCNSAGVPVVLYASDQAMAEQLAPLAPTRLLGSKREAGQHLVAELERTGVAAGWRLR